MKRNTTTRMLFFAALDIISVAAALWFAFLIRFDSQIPAEYYPFIARIIVLAVVLLLPTFYVKRLYSFTWSYVSSSELIAVVTATSISFALLAAAIFISDYFPRFLNFPRSTIIIAYLLTLVFTSASRLSKRIYLQMVSLRRMENKTRTLIVGAGDAGEQLLRNMLSAKNNPYFPVGFLDDSPIKKGVTIHGLKVLGKIDDLPFIAAKVDAKQLIIALPSADSKLIRKVIELGRNAQIRKIKVAPSLNEFIRGEISLKNLRDVDASDLLGRGEVILDEKSIEQFIKGKRLLVTGAAGSIGSELCRQVARFAPAAVMMLDQDETGIFTIAKEMKEHVTDSKLYSVVADITDEQKMHTVFAEYQPEVVFHAAAYKHVPLMEVQPDQAVKNNVFGTEVLARTAVEAKVEKFVFISTDKAVNPTSVMGATKRFGEMICQAYHQKGVTKFVSVRFGNVLDSRGSVIPIFREQIKKGGPVEVTHPDMERYFMLVSEACLLVMQAGAMGNGGEVFVLDMGKPVKIIDLAREMIQLSGFTPDVDIAIIFIGVRPGEKLFEEILTAEEGTAVTHHHKIFTANQPTSTQEAVDAQVTMLRQLVAAGDSAAIVSGLKKIIPSYR